MIYLKYGGGSMLVFSPLWKQLIDKKMTKTQLREKIKISSSTLATMGKDEYISMDVLDRICKTLNCKIQDVIEYREK